MINQIRNKILQKEVRNRLIKSLTADGFLIYVETIYQYYYKAPFVRAWWHELVAEMLIDILKGELTRLLWNMPPRTRKTDIGVRMFVSYSIGMSAESDKVKNALKFIYGTYGQTLSSKTSIETKNILESDIYKEIFPSVKLSLSQDLKDDWSLETNQSFFATSVAGSGTGVGADVYIADDLIKAVEADSKLVRDNAYGFYTSSALTRLQGLQAVVLIMQRVHEDDPAGRILKKAKEEGTLEEWIVFSLSAINEKEEIYEYKHLKVTRPPNTSIDDALFSLKDLTTKKREMSKSDWERQYMQNPQPSETGFFNKSDRLYIAPHEIKRGYQYVIIDPAESESSDADHRAIGVIEKSTDISEIVTTTIVDGRVGRWDIYSFCENIIDVGVNYPDAMFLIEKAGGGITLSKILPKEILIYNAKAQSEGRNQFINSIKYFSPDNKISKNAIINLMQFPFEAHYIYINKFGNHKFMEQLEKELDRYSPERDNKEDNCIDVVSKSFFLKECVAKKELPPKPKPHRKSYSQKTKWRML